jgi:hypothetical protein
MRPAPGRMSVLTSRLCAVALAFWLGGVGCALCCSAGEASAAVSSEHDVRAERAASAPASCHARVRSGSEASGESDVAASSVSGQSPSRERAGACFAKARLASDPARKPRPAEGRTDAHPRRESSQAEAAASVAVRAHARSRPPDGSATHLRCRVFLI